MFTFSRFITYQNKYKFQCFPQIYRAHIINNYDKNDMILPDLHFRTRLSIFSINVLKYT